MKKLLISTLLLSFALMQVNDAMARGGNIPADLMIPDKEDPTYNTQVDKLTSYLNKQRKKAKKGADPAMVSYYYMPVANVGNEPIDVKFINSRGVLTEATAVGVDGWKKIEPGTWSVITQYRGLADIYALEKAHTAKGMEYSAAKGIGKKKYDMILEKNSPNIIRDGEFVYRTSYTK